MIVRGFAVALLLLFASAGRAQAGYYLNDDSLRVRYPHSWRALHDARAFIDEEEDAPGHARHRYYVAMHERGLGGVDHDAVADERDMRPTLDGTVKCWVRNYAKPNSLESRRDTLRALFQSDAWLEYEYNIEKLLFNCKDKTMAVVRTIYYDFEGNVLLDTGESTNAALADVVPGSVGEEELESLCEIYKGAVEKTRPQAKHGVNKAP